MRTDLQLLGLMPDVDAVLAALAALDTLSQTYAGTSTEQQADPSFEEDAREQAVAIDGVISNLSLPLTIVFRGGGATANGVLLDADEDGVLARMARAAVVAQRPVWRLTEAPPASCWPAVARALNATQHGHAEPLQTVDAPGFERLPEPGILRREYGEEVAKQRVYEAELAPQSIAIVAEPAEGLIERARDHLRRMTEDREVGGVRLVRHSLKDIPARLLHQPWFGTRPASSGSASPIGGASAGVGHCHDQDGTVGPDPKHTRIRKAPDTGVAIRSCECCESVW